MNLYLTLAFIVIWRVLSVFLVKTYFVPDEYWQSLEVAHRLVFGYGYLTWEWTEGIRSYLHPLWFAGIYKLLAHFKLDQVHLLILLPRLAQALVTAYADYRFFVWCGRKKWALFMTLISWFSFYIGSRTLTNTLEASLTTIALSYFPWHGVGTGYLWLVSLVCFLRPTAAIVWVPLCYYNLQKTRASLMQTLLIRFLPIGLIVGLVCVAVDSYFYGRWIITPYEFLKHNVLFNVGALYGTHPWHWYFTAGLPAVLGVNTCVFATAIFEILPNHEVFPVHKQLLKSILFTLIVLSTLAHKEFRFLAVLVPMCLYICADYLARWSRKAHTLSLWGITVILLAGNALPAWYLSTVHQRGSLDLMPKIIEIAQDYREGERGASILYLMPCHSTPYYSHVHENVTMRFLTCKPNLKSVDKYVDEADKFYDAPARWLRSHIPAYPMHALPSHLVFFEPLASDIQEFLLDYKKIHTIKHTEYTSDPRVGKNIFIYQRLGADDPINAYNIEGEPGVQAPAKKERLYPDPNVEAQDSLYDEKNSRNAYNFN